MAILETGETLTDGVIKVTSLRGADDENRIDPD
jgi:hypothetical protein